MSFYGGTRIEPIWIWLSTRDCCFNLILWDYLLEFCTHRHTRTHTQKQVRMSGQQRTNRHTNIQANKLAHTRTHTHTHVYACIIHKFNVMTQWNTQNSKLPNMHSNHHVSQNMGTNFANMTLQKKAHLFT